MSDRSERAVAIVGLGAILPDAPTAPAFRDNVWSRKYSIIDVPPERWSIADYYDPDPLAVAKTYTKIGSWVRGFQFDWQRWRIPPRVAAQMDEGQQWGVTIAAEALADYGWPNRPLDTERTGVILGNAMGGERHYTTALRVEFPEYRRLLVEAEEFQRLAPEVRESVLARWSELVARRMPEITEDSMPGELGNILAGRVANVLNLRGPNFTADAACASTLAAVDAAANLLLAGHCDAVVTGGIDRNMGVQSFVKFCKIGALSAVGSRPFGAGADGFVMGEGSAAFVIRRLADAERDGDRIYAVIRGIGASADGKGKGITAPNPIGQQLATQRAWEDAGLDPATATLLEAHGTSTKVGDVVEVESLAPVFKDANRGQIALGSAKSNIGHLKAAAGAAGLLKAVWALHEKVLPPTLNAETPNPGIDFAASPFRLNHELGEWKPANGAPRRCGVSAYGFGGTNFHVVLEEHVPGALTKGSRPAQVAVPASFGSGGAAVVGSPRRQPVRGLVVLGAASAEGLRDKVDALLARVKTGEVPPVAAPDPADLAAQERIAIDYEDGVELVERLHKAQKGLHKDTPHAWRAFQALGVFRGGGRAAGKIAFLFTGQGSQYVNMGRDLAAIEPVVADVFAEADRVLEPILGRKLTSYIFVDRKDAEAMKQAEEDLKQTAITQPAVLSMDTAMCRLLGQYGIEPDMVMGHSLGEYGALVSAQVLTFAEALEAAAARGREMSRVSFGDNGAMAAVMAPLDVVLDLLGQIPGYVTPANLNARGQVVIGGETPAVEAAVELFSKQGYQAQRLPVSHAFHTKIVAEAAAPLRKVLDGFDVRPPQRLLVGNVEADFYPSDPERIKDILCRQIASPVRWVESVERLYAAGARAFVEVGPKRALKGFVDDVLADKTDVISLYTNRARPKELAAFNAALAGLYAAGYGARAFESAAISVSRAPVVRRSASAPGPIAPAPAAAGSSTLDELRSLLQQTLDSLPATAAGQYEGPYDRNDVPQASIVISGTGLGLPGSKKSVMDPRNAERILGGEQLMDALPESARRGMASMRITRLVKTADGSGHFEVIEDEKDVIKIAGRAGYFDLSSEYGVPEKLIEALDLTTQLAIAAGLDALREAGIPLVQVYRKTSTGKYLPEKWMLPEALRDETGVVFASAFPALNRFADEAKRYYTYESRRAQRRQLQDVLGLTRDEAAHSEIERRIAELDRLLETEAYTFDRRFLLRVLTMGHSQFAEYIGARGPNTHVNAACASTATAISLAEDWIRAGRCRRVIVISGDDVTSEHLIEWMGAGFLAVGAAASDARVEDAALPFDRRRHGMLIGMGACALVVESQDCLEDRGMRGIVELLSTEARNSAFHATRLDVDHISDVVESLISSGERRFGIDRRAIAPKTVFVSHETYTPARGGSAAAEVQSLRRVFGPDANEIVVSNTKGFTGHAMGVGVEDVIAVKILEHGIVPPVPNFKEPDPELGMLTLSKGGRYPVEFAIHLAAGFGSEIALTLTRKIPGCAERVAEPARYERWLADVSGYPHVETEVVKRVLRVVAQGAPGRPAPSPWRFGLGPTKRVPFPGDRVRPVAAARPVVRPAPVLAGAPIAAAAPAPSVAAVPAVAPPPGAAPAAAAPAQDAVVARVLAIVAEKTGYPPDMLDLELDLEADLGVDTVKQAETFAAVREAYDIPRQESLKLRDFPTLRHVAQFVYDNRPDLKPSAPAAPAATSSAVPASLVVAGSLPAAAPVRAVAPVVADPVAQKVLAIVSEKTGYPADMLELDLDLEADLGVDTVKQAETFAAVREAYDIPRQENLKLRDFPTLRHVMQFVYDSRPDMKPVAMPAAAMPVAPAAASAVADPVVQKVLAIVAEKTGYPQDMLELDLDLEADLGVDTVKQAETFAAVRDAYGIERQENLKLRDFPTLRSVVGFVYQFRPDLRPAVPLSATATVPASAAPAAAVTAAAVAVPASAATGVVAAGVMAAGGVPTAAELADPVVQKVLAVVADKTGYPQDMLELDLDLEADLGVDTVKQAETFAAVRDAYGIQRQENLKLRDFPTLRSVVGFVYQFRPDLTPAVSLTPVAAAAPAVAPAAPAPAAPAVASAAMVAAQPIGAGLTDPVVQKVLAVVAEKTGYPEDMLELDLDLEADLGVDTVKQAETFAAVREAYAIERQESLKLRDFPTLRSVVGFVYQFRPDLKPVASLAPVAGAPARAAAPVALPAAAPATGAPVRIEDADKMPRRVPVPSLRPALDLCLPTGVALASGTRVVIAADEGLVARALAGLLEKRGVSVLTLASGTATADVTAQVAAWLQAGKVHGVYWLPALDVEPLLAELDLAAFREANRRRVKNLHAAMRALFDSVAEAGTFLVSATRMGGLHGQTPEGATAPLGGAVAGFTKAYKRERADVLVKAVDFAPGASAAEVAEALVAETLADPGVVEVGRHDDLRWTITLEEQPAKDGRPGLALTKDTVFVVTGAAGGITSAIVADLAGASGGTFYLLDLVAAPARDDEHIALLRRDREKLKAALIEEARAKGEKPTPVMIDKQIMATERAAAALRAIESVEAVGGRALWRSVNLLDGPAVTAIVDEIREAHGRIDVLVHAGGIEISRRLSDKEAKEFDLVFDIKADGFFSLLRAAKGMPLGATVVFSSIAGRFGNAGQTDYSSANALLCSMSRALVRARPETRAIAIDWTAWGGIGMATRGSIPQIMAAAGITMLPPESGIPTVRRELVAGGGSGEVVVAGTLGIMTAEFAPNGGLDLGKAKAVLAARERPLVMVGELKAARLYGGLDVATTLDPKVQPFLFDHQIDGVPVLPGVMGTEAFAAVASVLAPGFALAAIEDETFLSPFKFHRNQPATLHLSAVAAPAGIGELLVSAELRSIIQPRPELPAQERVHFKARVRLRREPGEKPKVAFRKPAAKALTIGKQPIYGVYFHGPAYQVIERAAVEDGSVVALMSDDLGPNASPANAATVTGPRLLELLFQAAGLWLIVRKETMALPTSLERAVFHRQPEEARERRLYALVEVREDGAAFDGKVVDEKGLVYAEVVAYRTVPLPGRRSLQA